MGIRHWSVYINCYNIGNTYSGHKIPVLGNYDTKKYNGLGTSKFSVLLTVDEINIKKQTSKGQSLTLFYNKQLTTLILKHAQYPNQLPLS